MMSKTTCWLILIYGIVIMTLGYIGYMQAQSIPSLMAGLALGGLLVLSAIGMFVHQKVGAYVAFATTILLTAVFAYRYAISGSRLPAILAIISATMLIYLFVRFASWKSK
jgi:uncharacterized membrane protein (UPF0136 family)